MPAYETIYLRVPPELKDWLREEADREHTTMQDLIIQGVERLRLERATQKPAKPQAAEARSRT